MPKKQRLLLLDAMTVVAAHEVGVWDRLVKEYSILVPSVVVDEAHFYQDPPRSGRKFLIDLASMEADGTIQVCEMDQNDIDVLLGRFDGSFSIHAGEAEALAYLVSADEDLDVRLVTSDRAALTAVALLDLNHRSTCLADALRACGLSKRLDRQYEADHHRECLAEGTQMRIQGRGLARRA